MSSKTRDVIFNISDKLEEVQRLNPSSFTKVNFVEKTEREKLSVAYTVPIFIPLTDLEYDNIRTRRGRKNLIIKLIKDKKIDLDTTKYACFGTSEPTAETSYKKNILSVKRYYEEKISSSLGIKKKDLRRDGFLCWLDYKNKNVYLTVHNGSKIK